MKSKVKKHVSLVLAVAMLISVFAGYLPALAAEPTEPASTGLCVHHQEHTEECGYAAATEGQSCTHEHDESCGYVEAVEEVPCDMGCTDTDGDGVVDHVEGCAYQPAVEGQPCNHTHDESCGYVEATEGQSCTYAVNGCPYCVTSWTWVDEEELLVESEGSWGLGMPGVSQDNPLTREALAELLPTQILATTDSGEELPLDLTWDLTALPEAGATEGDYTVTASLPDPYALTESAEALSVTLQLGGAETYTQLPSGTVSDAPLQEYLVNGVSPNGTTIDLFDYWLTGQTNADNNDPWYGNTNLTEISGINNNHDLLFSASKESRIEAWNKWTGNKNPYKGIVQNKLGSDGYPVLNVGGKESLAYLFDPDMTNSGKASYPNVQGLLQVDSEGYYYYNSTKNYAVYYQESNSFALYEYPGIVSNGQSGTKGQFFPFNEVTNNQIQNGLVNSNLSTDASLNHYFGLHMSTRFIQQNNGHTDKDEKKPVTYEFSGDDDVWIFIDGVLVADLGGIHDAASVKINFATGEIQINGVTQPETLGTILGTGSNTLPNNTYHTLDFFYLERGNVDSNMNLKYNLVTIPESDLIKVDQLGNPVPGAEFTLYAADDYQNSGENATPIATGTTDANGEFVFLRKDASGNSYPITINELYEKYKDKKDGNENNLILVETKTPEGYRSVGEIGLYFYEKNDEVLLLSNSIWDEGAYAMAKVTTTTANSIQLLKDASDVTGTNTGETVTLVGHDAVENPVMFAVVFQKQADGAWYPVSGDPLSGWTVQDGNDWDNVLAAAKDSPYLFQLASSGAYQVEVSNLPGDVRDYYHFTKNADTAKYTIAYYYTEADSLAGANAQNTYRIASESTKYPLDRVFSMDLYVSNVKNYLMVQKVDEEESPVTGARFALYKAENVTVRGDTVTVPEDANPYDSLTTENVTGILKLNGGGVFPTGDGVLENGEYYLIETSAPTGYKLNDTAIHVIVDNTGVYADAGEADDGVTVLRGVGSVLKSMVQFAVDDGVDTTLLDIKAALASVTYDGYHEDGSFTVSAADWSGDNVLHLKYANANKLLDYGLYDAAAQSTIDNLTLETDAGWSKLLIQQCYQHEGSPDTGLKTNLGTTDITGLFSGTVTVRVANDRIGNLKISKTVTGENVPANQSFTFSVRVTDEDAAISGTYETVDGNDKPGTINFNNGTAIVTLKDGETLTIMGLPAGAQFTVTETSVNGFTPKVSVNNGTAVESATATGTIPHSTTDTEIAEVAYTNAFDGSARMALEGTKTLQGRKLATSDAFTFRLTAGNDVTSQAIKNGDIVLPTSDTVTVNGEGASDTADFSFGAITFKQAGEYTFKITEDLPTGSGVTAENPVSNGIWYDTHTATATVTVTKGADGILSATVNYDNTGAAASADAENTGKAAFTNAAASLTVSKTVTGDMGDRDKEFTFQITLKNAAGNALTGTYRYAGATVAGVSGVTAPANGTLTVNADGTATFGLKHGQSITIYGLPADSQYEILETDAQADGYTTNVTVNGGTPATAYSTGLKSLTGKGDSVAFENSRDQVPVTGVLLDHWPWLMAAGVCLAGGAALMVLRSVRRVQGRPAGKRLSSKREKHD